MDLSIRCKKNSGTILIIALWTLGLLTVFAITLGVRVRQKIILLSRLESRNKLSLIASSGIKKAISMLNNDFKDYASLYTPDGKVAHHNNSIEFRSIDFDDGTCEISYNLAGRNKRYGVIDEESKININVVDKQVLRRLIEDVLDLDKISASELANSIIDWREYGESEIVGFYSDQYYDNLQFPYPVKNDDFEIMEELLLVKGMNKRIFDKLFSYITIYGDGKININTASPTVLISLGLSNDLVNDILFVRKGVDGIDFTKDDFIFQDTEDLVAAINSSFNLSEEEITQINDLITSQMIGVNSYFFLIKSQAKLHNNNARHTVQCVYNMLDRKIEYWKEML